jgi:hypothetical protein
MKQVLVYSVIFEGKLRLTSLRLGECEDYATEIFNDRFRNPTRVIPEIYEQDVIPVDHTQVS